MSKNIKLSDKQKAFVKRPFTHSLEVLEGTPRSSKTTAGHFRYAKYLFKSKQENHLIVAYNQEQAYRLFIDGDGTGLKNIFQDYAELRNDEHGAHLLIDFGDMKKKVYYKGGGKSDSKKAITGMTLGSVVFCEIDLLHMDMVQECFRRTFAAKDRFHLADLNPPAPQHPIIKEVFDVQNTYWTHWRMADNPLFDEEMLKDKEETLIKNPYLYKRDWLGQRVIPTGVIYSMFNHDEHIKETIDGKPIEMFFSADGGQSDATSASCNIVTRMKDKTFRLYRVAHYYHSGADTVQVKAMSVYAKEIKEFINWCKNEYDMYFTHVFVDPACKSLREELHMINIDTDKADNNAREARGIGKGIEIGIERVQNAMTDGLFYLVDNDTYDHYHFLKEIGMYARDKNGKPIDDYNHALDELRYSINYHYKRYVL